MSYNEESQTNNGPYESTESTFDHYKMPDQYYHCPPMPRLPHPPDGTHTQYGLNNDATNSYSTSPYFSARFVNNNTSEEYNESSERAYDSYNGGTYPNVMATVPANQKYSDEMNEDPAEYSYTPRLPMNKRTSPYFDRIHSSSVPPNESAHHHGPDASNTSQKMAYFTQEPNYSRQSTPKQHGPDASTIFRKSPYFTEESNIDVGIEGTYTSGSSELSTSSTAHRPTPAKSAFMCFSEAMCKENAKRTGKSCKDGSVESVANEWRALSEDDRACWEDMALKEKSRYAKEKDAYKGPLTRKLRTKKNPLAPKRPMSAFLMYAQQKRKILQKENPDMSNADISRLLGEMWRNASKPEKRPFLEREESERKFYRAKMESWKSDQKLAKSMMKHPAMTKSLNSESIIEQREDVEETNNDAQRFVSHSNAEQDAELYAEPYAEPYAMPSIEPYVEQYNQEPQTSCNYQHTSNYAQDRVDIPVQEYDDSTYYGNQEPCYTKWVYPRPEEENPY